MAVTIEHAKVQRDESAQVREELARLIFKVNAPKQKKAERFGICSLMGFSDYNRIVTGKAHAR